MKVGVAGTGGGGEGGLSLRYYHILFSTTVVLGVPDSNTGLFERVSNEMIIASS